MDTICRVQIAYCSTNYRHPYGNKLPFQYASLLSWHNDYTKANHRYIDNLLSINNTNCANWIPLTYPQKKQHKQLLPTWNLTPMVNFLTDSMTEETNSILQLYVFYTLILRYQ